MIGYELQQNQSVSIHAGDNPGSGGCFHGIQRIPFSFAPFFPFATLSTITFGDFEARILA